MMPDRYGDNSEPDAGEDRRAHLYAHAIAAARAVRECELCNSDGYRGSTVCDHIDHAQAAKRGMAMVRAAMGWKP